MSNDEWWAAQRRAAEFWRKVGRNQTTPAVRVYR